MDDSKDPKDRSQTTDLSSSDKQIQHHHSVAPGEWAVQKLLGPSLDAMGEDLRRAYAAARDKILNSAIRKTPDLGDGSRANLRIAHEVLTSGAFSESEICAEYFGGILASSRSANGEDDGVMQFVETTKSLSSKQLHLHYVIYNRINKLLVSNSVDVNVGMGNELQAHLAWFSSIELAQDLELPIDTDSHVLYKHGLIANYDMNNHQEGDLVIPYCFVAPSTFGVLLYAASHNLYKEWRNFNSLDFGDYKDIALPRIYESSLENLKDRFLPARRSD